MSHPSGLRRAIDIRGTFTDSVLMAGHTRIFATAKTPTTPAQPAHGALDGAGRVLAASGATWDQVGRLIHGTTRAMNAPIERRGARVVTVTTEGFRDILEIGYERRHSQYAMDIEKPDLIVRRARAFTIGGRIDVAGAEVAPLDEATSDRLARQLAGAGIEAVAICFLHAHANPAHERRLADLLHARLRDLVISVSHEVSPEAREFDRLCTTIASAGIEPLMAGYLADFLTIFRDEGLTAPILMVTASGGMTTPETAARLPIRLIESGPTGGAILAARIAAETGERQVRSFGMGGTTAKLYLIDDHRPQTVRKFEISRADRFIKGSGMPVRIPVIEMIEIGAGGGSIARVDGLSRLHVGPESAGSDPGPAAFGLGGTRATVTDADVVLALIDPARFAEARLAFDSGAAARALSRDVGEKLGLSPKVAAFGVSEIVDESMAGAGRMHAVEFGKGLGARLMIAFGGNVPLHATRVARRSGVSRILIPSDPGVRSAVGFLFAPVSFEIVRSGYTTFDQLNIDGLSAFFAAMEDEATAAVRRGAPAGPLTIRRIAFMRHHGQGHEIETPLRGRPLRARDIEALRQSFEAAYSRQFSRIVPDMTIEVLNWALTVRTQAPDLSPAPTTSPGPHRSPAATRRIVCDVTGAPSDAGQHDRAALNFGDRIAGPALIVEPQTTTLVSADFEAQVDGQCNLWLTQTKDRPR